MGAFDIELPNLVPSVEAAFVSNLPASMQQAYCRAVRLRDLAYMALEKAIIAGKSYTAEGLMITRYDLEKLRAEYVFWQQQVDLIAAGNSGTMQYKRIIPLDLG